MKKLFSFLCLLMLGAGMSAWAQSSTTTNYTWDELLQEPYVAISGSATIMYKYVWARGGGSYPAFWFYILFNKSEMVTYNGRTYPAKGAYTISSNLSNPNVIGNYQVANTESGSSTKCRTEYDVTGSKYYLPIGGSGTVSEGADLPYITYSATSNKNASGNTVTSGQYQKIYVNIGTAATYRSVSVVSNNATMGTVSYDIKSGYVYEVDGTYCKHWKNNSVYTLTATPNSGYRFVCWKKGSTQISTNAVTDVTIDGNATYTAYFEPQGGTQYTITVQANNDAYCTVSGGGTYYEGEEITISSASKNEHLYIFDHWLKDGNNYAGGTTITPTVTANATYTAVFRAAAAGTITGVADHGTISGTGNYAGGTAVQLGVTAADGYVFTQWSDGNTDNPRTVYVDGNKNYTAQFVEGVEIYDEEGVFEIGTSHTGYFTIRGDGNGYHAELNYNATILDGVHTYTYAQLDNSTDWSWIKPDGGSKVAITNAETTIDYYGLNYRAAHLVSKVTCANGKVYMVEIYTNRGTECGGFIESSSMGFRDDGYGGWNLASSPIVTPLHFSGPSEQNTGETGGILLKWSSYRGDPYYETINLALDFVLEHGATSIPSGRYPINGTRKPGTVFIGGMNADQFFSSYAEYNLGQMFSSRYNNWVYRRGYVDVINKGDGTYYIDCKGLSDSGAELYFTSGTMPVISTYALSWDANGGELSGTYTAAGDYEEGAAITAPTATKNGYTFVKWRDVTNGVDFTGTMPSSNVTYTAQWNIVNYNLTYEGLEGATNNTNPTTYNVESETITLADPGARDGYAFIGWTINGTPVTEITHGSTGDKTITANWNAKLSSITLEDNRENSFYNTFKSTYNGESGLIVTYARRFTQGRWSTLCLPFSVNKAMFSTLNFGSRIYEFKYATGNANDGSGVNLYFSIAKSIEAGKGYIVNADATLAARTSFTFSGVTMDLSADKGDELNSVTAYDKLTGSSSEGNIELVGTLRKGTLKGTAADNRYMGLKGNKIYYPNITTGSTILAYRGIFRSKTGTLNAERIRIIVDGEEKAELEVINGELQDVQETKKFIENGVLYIERNGIIYDATGRKVE